MQATTCPLCSPMFIGKCVHGHTEQNKYALGKQNTLAELCAKKDAQIEFLWGLLDDISTSGDMYKPEHTAYFKYVNDMCEKRSEVAESDGYKLKIKGLFD